MTTIFRLYLLAALFFGFGTSNDVPDGDYIAVVNQSHFVRYVRDEAERNRTLGEENEMEPGSSQQEEATSEVVKYTVYKSSTEDGEEKWKWEKCNEGFAWSCLNSPSNDNGEWSTASPGLDSEDDELRLYRRTVPRVLSTSIALQKDSRPKLSLKKIISDPSWLVLRLSIGLLKRVIAFARRSTSASERSI